MKVLEKLNRWLASLFIADFDDIYNKQVRIQYGLLAGWISIIATLALFIVKMILGLMAGSISVVANAFHLLSHLANSIILVVSFKLTARHHKIEAVISLTVIGGLIAGHYFQTA